MSEKKPTLEDLVRMVCKVRARMAKELIGIRVTIESFPLDPPKKPAPTNSTSKGAALSRAK